MHILAQVLLRVLRRAGWRWLELGRGGWSWVEKGASFNNTHFFSISYKKASDEVDFLHVEKHESFTQIDTGGDYLILMGMFKHSQSL